MSNIMSLSGFSLICMLLLFARCWRAQAQDSGSPIITNCPNNLKIDVPSSFQSLRVFWEEPTAADDNGSITVMKSHTSGAIFPADQTTIVQYVFTNLGRQSSECQFEILLSRTCDVLMPCVDNGLCYNDFQSNRECMPISFPYTLCNYIDTTPPNCVNVPNNIFVTVELGIPGTAVFWNEPTCTDDSGKASIFSRSHSPSTFFTVGETTVLYTCEDMSGNINTCIFTVVVNVVDTIPPIISNCPDDVSLVVELGGAGGTVFWSEPTATDISGTAVLRTRSHSPGSSFPIGATRVTYEFSDASANIALCAFFVVVNTVDTTPPTISNCPTDVALDIELGGTGGTVFWLEPTATDISGVAVLSSRSHTPGSSFPIGATTVTYEFSDASANIAVCAFFVVVNTVNSTFSSVCNNIPVDIVETVELGTNGTIITWREPTCSDTFGNAAVLLFKSHTPPSFFTVGTTTVNYTCLSSSGNVTWCDFTVTVNAAATSDHRDLWQLRCLAIPVSSLPGHFSCPGKEARVRIEDTTPPAVICVEDLQQTIELGVTGAIVVWTEPTATDISGFVSLESRSHNPGSLFDVGQTIVTYLFSDSAGNTASCIFVVEVISGEDCFF
ncbi:Hyalin [Holothuria leucospilota]|uniref:Hyalin n=1 Tax=Holothuria leucospilota TaxID=206669 RepID=A0A9Q1C5Z1_HOLLE|nr:Hyalin [Holothuria leucospilota]